MQGLVSPGICSPSVLGFRGRPSSGPPATEALVVLLNGPRAPRAPTFLLKDDKAIPIPGTFLSINPSQALRD